MQAIERERIRRERAEKALSALRRRRRRDAEKRLIVKRGSGACECSACGASFYPLFKHTCATLARAAGERFKGRARSEPAIVDAATPPIKRIEALEMFRFGAC